MRVKRIAIVPKDLQAAASVSDVVLADTHQAVATKSAVEFGDGARQRLRLARKIKRVELKGRDRVLDQPLQFSERCEPGELISGSSGCQAFRCPFLQVAVVAREHPRTVGLIPTSDELRDMLLNLVLL